MPGVFSLHPHIHALPPWVGLSITIVTCGGAFWKGDREQQGAALAVLLSWLTSIILLDRRWVGPQWGAFGADIALFVVLTVIAIRSPRYWPMVAAAFQLLCVMIHVARMMDPGVRAWAYASGQIIFTDLLEISIGVGTLNTWLGYRRARRAMAGNVG